MKRELESVLELASTTPREELPQLLGDLERIRVTALDRLTRHTEENDENLSVDAATARLNVSVDYMYRNHSKFSFTRREGRNCSLVPWDCVLTCQERALHCMPSGSYTACLAVPRYRECG